MHFSDLVSFQNGKKRHGVLLIMPFFKEYDILSRHISILSKQTDKRFDVILILDPVSNEAEVAKAIKRDEINIILAKMKDPIGPAGAFFTGEKFALDNGYEAVIYADSDALPSDDSLMKKLLAEHAGGAELAQPKCILQFNDKPVREAGGIHYYSLVGARLLRRDGLHYAPIFIGADDAEFASRISRQARFKLIDSSVSHPVAHSIFTNFERSALYRVNNDIMGVPGNLGNYLYDFGFVILPYLVFGSARARRAGLHIVRCLFSHRYGLNAILKPNPNENRPEPPELVVSPAPLPEEKNAVGYNFNSRQLRTLLTKGFCKRVLLYPIKSTDVAPMILAAAEVWISSNQGVFLLSRSGGSAIHAVRLITYTVAMPFFLALGTSLFLLNCLRRPKTLGYGLE